MANYQIMTKIKNIETGRTMTVFPRERFNIGQVIRYMWELWEVVEVYG